MVIKGEALRRFPSGNFLDAVNGLFPWVFSQSPDANNYLFVVNGFLLADINAISLNDIEEVSFSRSLNGSLYPFSRAGTFYITTKKYSGGKMTINFNTQYNVVNQKDNTNNYQAFNLAYNNSTKNKWGHLSNNNLSVLTGGNKWDLFVSAQLNQTTLPKGVTNSTQYVSSTNLRQDSSITTGTQNQLNLTSFIQFTYHFSSKLQAGISGNYFHGTTKSDTALSEYADANVHGTEKFSAKSSLPYYHTAAFIYWTPLPQLSNRISFEYAQDNFHDHSNDDRSGFSSINPAYTSAGTTDNKAYSKRLLLKNDLKYIFLNNSKFQSGVDLLFSYLVQKQDYQNNQFYTDSYGSLSASTYHLFGDQKVTSLNPQFYFSYNHQISGYAGYAWLLNKSPASLVASSKSNPYAGLVFNFKNIIHADKKVSRFDISFEYGDLTKNNSNNNWLPGISKVDQFSPSPVLDVYNQIDASVLPAVYHGSFLKNRSFTAQANISLSGDRISAGIQWSSLQSEMIYAYFFNNFFYPVKIKETHQGYSAYVAAKLVNKPTFTWTIRFNTLVMPAPYYKSSDNAAVYTIPPQDQLQAGIQNYIGFKNWYAQVNGLMALNNETVNIYSLNYLLIGYHFSGTAGSLSQKIGVFLQARNLLSNSASKDFYGYYTYAGAGINLTL